MIRGRVSDDREAIISIAIPSGDESELEVDAVVDTGFNGFLTLPRETLELLDATRIGRAQVLLADGSTSVCDLFELTINWDGSARTIEVDAAETMPLIDMRLLDGFVVTIDASIGGLVSILPSTPTPNFN